MKSQRIQQLEQACKARGQHQPLAHFDYDYHTSGLTLFASCPPWEKTARAMAYAIVNQDIYVEDSDCIGGRIYYANQKPVDTICPDLDCVTLAQEAFLSCYPEGRELEENQLIGYHAYGHITWFYDRILTLGVDRFRRMYEEALSRAQDQEAEEFYQGVLILLDALMEFNDKHIAAYRTIGNHAMADLMEKVPRMPATSFREAVQAWFMQHLVVMRENPYGGNGPGRLDYYLWPYLERDLAAGRCTMEEAKELIDELFLRIDERIHDLDMWVEAIVVGGTHPNGSSAVNPLTYLMIQSIMDLNITHPSIYVRLPENPPEELLTMCAKYMMSGNNRAQILNDPAIIGALMERGTPFRDAVEYACGGCMEVGVQGMTSDYLYIGMQNPAKMLELMITGGLCLRTGKQISSFHATKSLAGYDDFDSFYRDFIQEADRLTKIFLHKQDIFSARAQVARPSYLISSMIEDCLGRGRNMHAGGARYHDYGGTHLALPDVADALYTIKCAVFDQQLCSATELITALKENYQGYAGLQAKLKALPKYGNDHQAADSFAAQVISDFADMYNSYVTRWNGKGKPVILTFVYSADAIRILGATASGRLAGRGVSHGLTPHYDSMKEGITAAINSCGKVPFHKYAGGASTMWDFDSSWVNEERIVAILKTFLAQGGQIFQGNTTSVDELKDAQIHPENYPHLMVRVGGYSARFTTLPPELQEEIIHRIRHCH